MPLVSVLMPVFNRENLVADAIRSIQNQTLQDWELVILDDASTDRTLDICRSFAAKDNRIRIFSNDQNLGVGKSRNRLVSYASGEYIAIQDSDDVSLPERLKEQFDVLQSNPEIGLVSGLAAWVDEEGQILGHEPKVLARGEQYPQNKKKLIEMLYMDCEISNPTIMYRRSLDMPEPFGDYRVGEDWYFFLKVAHRKKIWGIPKVLVKMKRGKSHTHLWKDYTSNLRLIRGLRMDMYEHFKKDPDSPINYWLYRKATSDMLTRIGRASGGWRGYLNLMEAIVYDPFSRYSWQSFIQASRRGISKAKRQLFKGSNVAESTVQ